MEKELKQAIELFLVSNNIVFNKEELKLQLLTHPYFPSINAITDLFDHFKIENIAAELPKEIAVISELPTSFLAHITEDGSEKIVLVIKKSEELKLVYSTKSSKRVTYAQFVNDWSGVIVAVEKEDVHHKNKSKTTSVLKTGSYVLLSALIGTTLFFNPLDLVGLNYLFVTVIGLYTSILLVQKELGLHSKSLDKFCEASNNSSCDDVLNSKGALLFGLFKLSDVGIVYFTTISLILLISSITATAVNYMLFYGISILSTLFIPYSLYYQWRVIKKWCPLCLIVLGVLFLQAMSLIIFLDVDFQFQFRDLYIPLFSLLMVSVFWFELKPGLKKKQEFDVLQLEHYKFKRNTSLFTTALQSSDQKNVTIEGINEIVLGNKNAPLKIVLITNPLCFFCKEAHQVFHALLNDRRDNLQIIIRFNINTSIETENKGLDISNELLEIYKNQREEVYTEALNDIYSDLSPDAWLQKWKTSSKINHLSILEKEKEWCINNTINFTPAVFINGYLFPKEYKVSDISFFIDHLIENQV